MGYNSQFVEIWEGRPFVHVWQGRVQRDRRVNSGKNKQSDNSPGEGAFSPHVRMVPCILHLWVMFLYLAMTLGLVVNGRSATTLLMEIPAGLLYLCIPIVFFYFTAKLAFEEIPSKQVKRRRNSLYRHPMNCNCPLCTMNLRCAQSSKHSRGGVKYTTFLFPPRQQTPDQRDALMVIENWNSLEVNRLLLVLAGDVEVNPGPITLHDLTEELEKLTKPISFGINFKIPLEVLDSIARNQRKDDVDGQKRALFEYIASNYEKHEITWTKIADALEVVARDLAVDIRQKYCATFQSEETHNSSEDKMAESSEKDLTLKKPTVEETKSAVQVEGVYHSKKTTAEVRASLEVGGDTACGTDIHFLAESEDKVLNIDTHLQPVKHAVWTARSLCKEIGHVLGISDDTIRTIHCTNDGECLNEVLSLWIHSGKATISDLLRALANKTVDRNDIKNEIHILKGASEESREKRFSSEESVLESTVGHAHQLPSVSESNDETETTSTQSPSEDTNSSLSLKRSYLRFLCGCGKCSVLDYVSGKQCLNPKQLPFPKLGLSDNLSDLVPDIDIFEQSLLEQSREMYLKFVDLLMGTFQALDRSITSFREVKDYVVVLFQHQWYFPKTHCRDVIGSLENVETFQELRDYLHCNYCSWFNYDLIKCLREKFLFVCTQDQHLSDYEADFKRYVHNRCFLCLHDVGPSPDNHVEVKCKVDEEFTKMSGELIRHLKLQFTKIIGISDYHLTFKEARDGCTELFFRAPTYIQNLKRLSRFQKYKLKEHKFIEVRVGDQCLFRDDSKFEDPGTDLLFRDDSKLEDPGTDLLFRDDSKLEDPGTDLLCRDDSKLEDPGSISSSEASEIDDNSGVEGDVDTTDIEQPGVHQLERQIQYSGKCEEDLVLLKKLDIDVSPCSLWEAHHNGQPSMALVYNSQTRDDSRGIFDYAEKTLVERPNIMKVKCVHHDEKLSTHPVIVLEYEESLLDYCSRSRTPALSDVDQLSVLCDIALGVISFQSCCSSKLIVTKASIFLHKDKTGKIKAKLCPVYGHSYLPQQEGAFDSSTDLQWLKNITAVINNGKDGQAELPKNHILFNILQYKWLSEEQDKRPQRIVDVARELEYLLDLETTRIGMIDTLSRSNLLDVAHLHMLLIGHTGVGKTSIRKHLQDIPMDRNEKSTVIMEPELLCQETIEASTDKSESSFVFQLNDNVYKSEPDKVFLTLWDTGGQQMFQDLLSCFAKVRSIYGVVLRLPDLLSTERATVRPSGSVECHGEAPYTDSEYIYRSLAFLNAFSFDMHQRFSSLPVEVLGVFDSTELHSFPKVALIGTCKDKFAELNSDAKQDLKQKYHELKIGLQDFNLLDRTLLPAGEDGPVLFEIDNTKSGTKRGDPGIVNLRHQIVSCTQKVMAKIPSEWMSFKIELERESRLQHPCTGIVTLEKANEIASQHSLDPRVALTYFHELGIFLWYHYNQNLREYVIVEPKQLLNVLGAILDPAQYSNFPEEWKTLQSSGVLGCKLGDSLLDSHNTGLPLSWILNFLDDHHLAVPLQEGYFIPSMLQILPICPNHLHVQDMTSCTCTNVLHDGVVHPIFIVSRSEYIPSGLFPRLMTVLAGISNSNVAFSLPTSRANCRNIVTLIINEQFPVVFTEYIDCIRVHYSPPINSQNLPEMSKEIVTTLKVQLQRVLQQPGGHTLSITFSCTCSKNSKLHFLSNLPYATDDEVLCSVHEGSKMRLTDAHKVWLQTKPYNQEFSDTVRTQLEAEELLEEAIKKGVFSLSVTNILFTGFPGSGVTTCKNAILNHQPLSNTSAPLSLPLRLEHSFYIIQSESGSNDFKLMEPQDMNCIFARLASAPPKTVLTTPKETDKSFEQPSTFLAENAEVQGKQNDHILEVTDLNESSDVVSLLTVDSSPAIKDSHQDSITPLEPSDDNVMLVTSTETKDESVVSEETSKALVPSLIKLISTTSEEQCHLELAHIIDCTDPAFMEVLPIFIHELSLCVVCIDLTRNLDEPISNHHMSGVGSLQSTIYQNVTSRQMIYSNSHVASKILIVGNHADEDNPETRAANNEILRNCFEDELVLNGDDPIFPVNAISADQNTVHDIRERIVLLVKEGEQKPVPFSWHLLGHNILEEMTKHERKLSSRTECSVLCNLSDKDLSSALNHLHELGFLYYYEQILPDVVFGDIHIFSVIICEISRQKHQNPNLHRALVTKHHFQKIEGVYLEDLFTYKQTIKLFLDLFIVITLTTESLYIMPCLLEDVLEMEDLDKYCVNDPSVAPLVIQYTTKGSGIFSSLVCRLASQYNNSPWPWNVKVKENTNQPCCLFKNCVQFAVPGYNTIVTLVDIDNFLVVKVQFPQDLCFTLKNGILTALRKACQHLHCHVDPSIEVGFFCDCGISDKHTATYKNLQWKCSVTSNIKSLHSAKHDLWEDRDKSKFDGNLEDLSVHNALHVLLPFSEKWYEVGLSLGLPDDTMNTISVNYRQRPDLALHHIIKIWFYNASNPEWADVIKPIPRLGVGILDQQALKPLASLAVRYGQFKVVQYLTSVQMCNPNQYLLAACQYNQRHIVEYLLIDRYCDPNMKNKDNQTPLDLTTDDVIVRCLLKNGARADNVYKAHRKVLGKLSLMHAPENPLPILITGNGGAGKSTFLKAFLKKLSFGERMGITKAKAVVGVDQKTVGIIPYLRDTENFGRVAVYDFAGQREFLASHSAVLQNAIHTSPPVVVFCSDLQKSEEEIKVATTYWMNLIHHQCSALQEQAHVIVVGSHADVVKEKGEDPRSKEGIFSPIIEKFSKFKYLAFVPMDCRLPDSPGMKETRRHIENSSALLRSPVAITLNAHAFYIYFLDSFKDELAISLKTLRERIQADLEQAQSKSRKDLLSFIPNTLPRVVEICSQLSQKGHILFLPNESSPEESYVVCDQPTLLSKITGTIFAPEGFHQHCSLASSTGVVSLRKFSDAFKEYDLNMLIPYMTFLEFCFEIKDKESLEHIAMCEGVSADHLANRYLLFPGLIKIDILKEVWEPLQRELKFFFGWMLRCTQTVHFFGSRFLQVLLLRLSLSLGLAPEIHDDVPSLQRRCCIWKSGIYWCDDNGITCLVELIEQAKALAVQIRSDELTPECLDLRRRITSKVLETAKEFCPNVDTVEAIIEPSEVRTHPLKPISDLSLFKMETVATAVVHNKPNVTSVTRRVASPLKSIVQFEPYLCLSRKAFNFLFHPQNPALKEKVSNTFLSCFAARVQDPESVWLFSRILAQATPTRSSQASPSQELVHSLKVWRNETKGTYQCLRTTLDQYSIFGGRNPLDLAGVAPGDCDPSMFTDRVPDTVSSPHQQPDQLNVDDHLKEVRLATREVRAMWYDLAIELDIEEVTRKAIEKTHHHVVDDCFTALLEHWLKRTSPPPTWSALINALKSPSIGYVDLANEVEAMYVEMNVHSKHQTD